VRFSPVPDWNCSKYGAPLRPAVVNMFSDPSPPLLLGLDHQFKDLVGSSLSKASWQKYESGWRAFEQFENWSKEKFAWPLEARAVRGFVTWCSNYRGIRPNTTRTYLAALALAHKLKGFPRPPSLDDDLMKMALAGAEKRPSGPAPSPRPGRRVMSLPLLKILNHKLAISNWDETDVQAIWTIFSLGFFSSCRMGEILGNQDQLFDPSSTLTWADIKARKDGSFLAHIKNPKSGREGGEFVDIFPFEGHGVCPAAALARHMRLQKEAGLFSPSSPVFRFHNGKNITPPALNGILHELLQGVLDQSKDRITCHSFRAAVASALARFPELASSEEIKGWGRWESAAYTSYTRLNLDKKRAIFSKIVQALNA